MFTAVCLRLWHEQRRAHTRPAFWALLGVLVALLLLDPAPALAQDAQRVLTITVREWTLLPVYDGDNLRAVFAYRKTELKKFDVLWFDRREGGWAPYIYMGHDLPCAAARAENEFLNQALLHGDARFAPMLAGYDPEQETADFSQATNGRISLHFKAVPSEDGSFPGVFLGPNPDGIFGASVVNLKATTEDCCDTTQQAMAAAGNGQSTDGVAPVVSYWLDMLLDRGPGGTLATTCVLPWWSWTTCTPWAPAGPSVWVFISSTPAAGNIHCNYELQQPQTRTCTRTTNFCWWTWTTTWTETRTVTLESRTCTVESPGPCPPTPGC